MTGTESTATPDRAPHAARASPAIVALGLSLLVCVGILTGLGRPDVAELEARAHARLIEGNRVEAAIWFKRLLQRDPGNPDYRRGLALCAKTGG